MKTGVLLGKFMPPHKGHEMLISFAYQFVDILHIIIDNIDDGTFGEDYIPGEKRVSWIKAQYPNAEVKYLPSPMPQSPNLPDFWQIWRDTIHETVGYRTDYVFVGVPYGYDLAKNLEVTYIPVDISHEMHSISATEIRNDLNLHWDNLASFVKQDFLLKVAIVGPESTGKTTLTKKLAQAYKTNFVPEYARFYLEPLLNGLQISISDMKFEDHDFFRIIQGQKIFEKIQSTQANRVLFSDTDPLLTISWYDWIMKRSAPEDLKKLALANSYDLYLVTSPDIPWMPDVTRYKKMSLTRQNFFEQCINFLEENKRPYKIISGHYQNRFQQAKMIIDVLLQTKLHYNYFAQKWLTFG